MRGQESVVIVSRSGSLRRVVLVAGWAFALAGTPPALAAEQESPAAQAALRGASLLFEENRGQAPAGVLFLARGDGATVFLTADEVIVAPAGGPDGPLEPQRRRLHDRGGAVRPQGRELSRERRSFLTGDRAAWRTDVATWRQVVYPLVRPGVDLVVAMRDGEIAFEEIGPGASAAAPTVAAARAANGEAAPATPRVTFLSYLGGRRSEFVRASYLDHEGHLLVVGVTTSPDFPVRDALQPHLRDHPRSFVQDGFLSKIDLSRREVVFSTYFGGPGADDPGGVVSDETGAIYLVGKTSTADFPLTPGATFAGGESDAWLAKLDASGSRVIYGRLYGGEGLDRFEHLAYDGRGGLWVTGGSSSSTFPLVAPLYDRGDGPIRGTLLAKLRASDGVILFSTFFGLETHPTAIAVDPQGNPYVTGMARTPGLPVTPDAVQPEWGGWGPDRMGDAFVTKLAADGSRLLYSTHLGGPGDEYALAIAVDRDGSAHVGGLTTSPEMPTHRPLIGPGEHLRGWIAKLAPDGGSLVYGTFFGASGAEMVGGLALDAAGDLWVSGHTTSHDLPLVDPFQPQLNDVPQPNRFVFGDGFLAKLAADGSELLFSSYVGGSGDDVLRRPWIDFWNGIHVAGHTSSTQLPLVAPIQDRLVDEGQVGSSDMLLLSVEDARPERPALLLGGGRFRVELEWTDPYNNGGGVGHPAALTDDTGYLWFFDEDNVEVVVKVVDGRPVNGHFWVFFGALSTVEYRIGITDTVTGRRRVYLNPPTHLASRADTAAFPDSAAAGMVQPVQATQPAPIASAGAGSCPGTEVAACLAAGRFEVRVDWHDPRSGDRGQGRLQPLTEDTAAFWFFHPANIELVVKVLDGRAVNGHVWTFYGSLTDVELDILVRDTVTGAERRYYKPPHALASGADTRSF